MALYQPNLEKSKELVAKRKQAEEVARWSLFLEKHKGVYPPRIAAKHLDLTVQGVFAAANRGHLAFIEVGRERFYSKKDVDLYKTSSVRRGRHSVHVTPYPSFPKESARKILAIRKSRLAADLMGGDVKY